MPSLYAKNNHVHGSNLSRFIGRNTWIKYEVAIYAIYPQTVLANRLQVLTPSDYRHLLSRLGQPPAEITANATRAKDRDSHTCPQTVDFKPGRLSPRPEVILACWASSLIPFWQSDS